jgi:hypothetical protein
MHTVEIILRVFVVLAILVVALSIIGWITATWNGRNPFL